MSEILYYIFFTLSSFMELSINLFDVSGPSNMNNYHEDTVPLLIPLTDEAKHYNPFDPRALEASRPRKNQNINPPDPVPKKRPRTGVSHAPVYNLEQDPSKLKGRRILRKNMNIIDMRISKKTGRPLKPLKTIDVYKEIAYINEQGEKWIIPGMDGLETNTIENIRLYEKQILQQKTKFENRWKEFKEITEPALIAKLQIRVDYQKVENYFLMIHTIWWFSGGCLIFFYFIYCLYWYNYMWHNLVAKLHSYEKKMRKFATFQIVERVCSDEEYKLCTTYIKESLIIHNIRYDLLIEKDAFKPLLISMENYRDYSMSNGNFYVANRLVKHIEFILKYKKYFDSQIAKLRIKKKNELETFINRDITIITHDEILDFLG